MNGLNFADILGWTATALTLASFLSPKMFVLRLLNLTGCCFWVLFGILNNSKPVIVTNVVIAIIHIVWFYKSKSIKK